MRVGIICAGDKEIAPFLPILDCRKESEKAMLKFYEGLICDIEIVLLYSGVCKVNAAIATQILIDTYGADIIVNAGTAGGISDDLEVFDSVVSTEVAYHDVEPSILTGFHPWMETAYFKADPKLLKLMKRAMSRGGIEGKIYFGRMVTGEAFVSDEGRQEIIDRFDPLTVDMESASIAHVCYVNKIPFISIRCITDSAVHSGQAVFEENCHKASGIARDITIALLKEFQNQQTA